MDRDVNSLYGNMYKQVLRSRRKRQSDDPNTPNASPTLEAWPNCTFSLRTVSRNLCTVRSVDERWAAAYTLHFFSGTEDAHFLSKYNERASKFVVDGVLHGAYGAIAMPQVRRCLNMLKSRRHTRRAVVSMGGIGADDVNSPACISYLHFLPNNGYLDLIVYQRSLNLPGLMPYDCVLLTNLLIYVADATEFYPGHLRWTVGSLHMPEGAEKPKENLDAKSLVLNRSYLRDPEACIGLLCDPGAHKQYSVSDLLLGVERRT